MNPVRDVRSSFSRTSEHEVSSSRQDVSTRGLNRQVQFGRNEFRYDSNTKKSIYFLVFANNCLKSFV